jgi:predicted AAA+ superfamily ATPase
MKTIQRHLEKVISELLSVNKVLLIYGTRRVGKTYLLHCLLKNFSGKHILLNGEDFDVQELLSHRSAANYQRILGDAQLCVIDEAQVVKDIGQILKLMIDSSPNRTIIATGSSSFDLMNQAGEPLTGRQRSFMLFPIAQMELGEDVLEAHKQLEERLIFGSYPEIFNLADSASKVVFLRELVQSYLLKDILAFSGIRHSDKIFGLLRLIAYQAGSEVSYQEIATSLGINKLTVENYLDLLSKVFILYKLPAYSTNQRKEISKTAKWYFYDNGIRNAIINDFRLPALRNDLGLLWENYILSERMKHNAYQGRQVQYFFWRNYNQQEVDLLEWENGVLSAYECKYAPPKKMKIPPAFAASYPSVHMNWIHRDNYLEYIL